VLISHLRCPHHDAPRRFLTMARIPRCLRPFTTPTMFYDTDHVDALYDTDRVDVLYDNDHVDALYETDHAYATLRITNIFTPLHDCHVAIANQGSILLFFFLFFFFFFFFPPTAHDRETSMHIPRNPFLLHHVPCATSPRLDHGRIGLV